MMFECLPIMVLDADQKKKKKKKKKKKIRDLCKVASVWPSNISNAIYRIIQRFMCNVM